MFSSAESVPHLGTKAGCPAVHTKLEWEGYVPSSGISRDGCASPELGELW